MFENIIDDFKERLQQEADDELKVYQEDQNLENAPYIGIHSVRLREMLEEWYGDNIKDVLSYGEQVVLAFELIEQAYEEEKAAGIHLLSDYLYPTGTLEREEVAPHIVQLFHRRCIYDREICDLFSTRFLSKLINDDDEGEKWTREISSWYQSDNKWLARASVLAFTDLQDQSNKLELLYKTCDHVIKRREQVCKEAVGRLLRDIHDHDPEWVETFIWNHIRYFDWDSLNEALRTIPYEDRKAYLDRFKDTHFRNVKK